MNDYYYTNSATSSTHSFGDALLGFIVELIVYAIIYVIFSLLLSRIFKKAGVPQWIAWVPFYNAWKFLELGGQPGFWAILAFIPILNVVSGVFTIIAMYYIGKNLGKSGAFVLWAIFVPLVWFIWLGADKSKWGDRLVVAN